MPSWKVRLNRIDEMAVVQYNPCVSKIHYLSVKQFRMMIFLRARKKSQGSRAEASTESTIWSGSQYYRSPVFIAPCCIFVTYATHDDVSKLLLVYICETVSRCNAF